MADIQKKIANKDDTDKYISQVLSCKASQIREIFFRTVYDVRQQ